MTKKNPTPDADRDDKFVATTVTVIVLAGGVLSAFLLGVAAFTLIV